MTRRRPSFDLAALRNPAFRLLGFSQIVSVAADQVLNVAITISVLNTGADASVLGLVLACRGVGLLLFLLVGGVWVDRLPRRRVVVAAYWVQALAVGILLGASAHPLLWLLAGVNFLAGTLEAFIRPAFNALLSTILAEDQRISGRALIAVALRTAMIAGPGVCVALIALVGPRAAFGLTTAVFVLTAIVFRQVKEPEAAPRRDESMIAGIASGFAAVRSRPWMTVVLLFSTVELMFVLAPTQVLLPIVSRTVFHSDAVYGTGLACYGIGGLVGGLVTMMWRPRSPGTLAILCLPLYALVPLALLTAEHGWIIFAAYLVAGAGIETYAIHWDVAVQREIPHHLLGRVSSLAWLSTFGMMPIGQALTGPITEAIGATTLLWTAAAVMLLVPPLMLRVRGMRQFHTPVDPRADPSVTERMP